jgi:hypothetical protein
MDSALWVGVVLSALGVAILAGVILARRRESQARARANSQLPPLITHPSRARHELRPAGPVLGPGPDDSGADGDGYVGERYDGGPEMEMVDGRSVRFFRPLDRTLRMLPGRLEIVEGEDQGRDIRFVQTSEGIPEITFGRNPGPPHRHVQLLSPTVSRKHAVIEYDGGRWKITNLSTTNPVVVNDDALQPPHEHRVLSDGDRIEMGEVIFRYRER